LPTKRQPGPGRPPRDDDEAVEHVRHTHLLNPRIGYREAARRYFREHPDKLDVKLESAARRVADKARRADGRAPARPHLQALKMVQFRLFLLANELSGLVDRLEGQLPAGGNRSDRSEAELLAAILSMERILDEIRRARFEPPAEG
jgi:hypothetical protein